MPNHLDDVLLHAMDEPELSRVRPYSTNCEYCQLLRHIQYNRTASILAMPTLAILFSRRITSCPHRRRQSGLRAPAPCDASPTKKRNNLLTSFLMTPTGFPPPMNSSHSLTTV